MIPPARVLAAIDFSESSRSALACAARLARHSGAQLHIVHVPHPLVNAAAFERGASVTGEMCKELRAFAEATPAVRGDHRFHVVAGDAAQVIRDIAHRESCEVVVVGTRGLSGDARLPVGSTTEALLRQADLPVLVVPDTWKPPEPEADDLTGVGPVIAGLDFTCPSIDAATAGARLAARLKTRLLLVHIVAPLQTPSRWRLDAEAIARRQVDEATARVAPLVDGLRAIAPVEVRIEVGAIASRLADIAQAMPRAVLVLGRARRPHGYGPPGAITSRVLMLPDTPLLLHIPSP